MEEVSKDLTIAVSDEIRQALEPILKRNGLMLTKFNSKYGDSFGLNITAVLENLSDDGINLSAPEAVYYKRYGYKVFINRDVCHELTAQLGTGFMSNNRDFVFAGIRTKGKNRIVALCLNDGKNYSFPDSFIHTINKASK